MPLIPTTIISAPSAGSSIVATGTKDSSTNVSSTVEASADVLVTANSFVADGSTYWVDFHCAYVSHNGSQTPITVFIFLDGNSVGIASIIFPTSGDLLSANFRVPVTPAAGTRTYSARATVNTGSVTFVAGTGGSGNYIPMSITVTKQ